MDVVEKIKDFICSELAFDIHKESIAADSDLLSKGIIDSMGIMQLVPFLEENFGVSIKPEDVIPENFQSLNSLKLFLDRKLNS